MTCGILSSGPPLDKTDGYKILPFKWKMQGKETRMAGIDFKKNLSARV